MIAMQIAIAKPVPAKRKLVHAQNPNPAVAPPKIFTKRSRLTSSENPQSRHFILILTFLDGSPNASAQRRPCNGGAAAMKRASGGHRPRIDAPCYTFTAMCLSFHSPRERKG